MSEAQMLRVVVFFNDNLIYRLETDKDVVNIGRWDANEIQLDNAGVSKIHAKIKRLDQGYVLEDCNSTNGTFIKEEPITTAPLSSGAVIKISKYTLVCEFIDKEAKGGFTTDSIPQTVKL
ncbi:MAG: FHA domain-containing protein [Sedimenticola sp.]